MGLIDDYRFLVSSRFLLGFVCCLAVLVTVGRIGFLECFKIRLSKQPLKDRTMNKPFITQAQLALYKYQSDRQSQEKSEQKPKIDKHHHAPTLPMPFKK
ncbi:hypothetical protein [Neisseria meningitidis]|uniref:hypothetical protein n=1 Tax=Neisseria meningitidis TaxID=487 RepID=UPI00192A1B0A|nr:hypothetical protein [Neisseria meningitidis]